MIELIVLLSTSYILLFALVLMGSVLLRRARTDVAGDAAPEGANRDGGDEDVTVGV